MYYETSQGQNIKDKGKGVARAELKDRIKEENKAKYRAVAILTVPGGQVLHFPHFSESSNFNHFLKLFFLHFF